MENGADVNFSGSLSPLYQAVKMNSPELVKLLLEHGANPNLEVDRWKPPLLSAVKMNSPEKIKLEVVKLLLNHGADPNHRDTLEVYPMSIGIEQNSLELVRLLLEYQDDTSINTDSLLYAAKHRRSEIVKLLLEVLMFKSPIDIADTLHHLCRDNPILDDLKFLVDCGLNIDVQGRTGSTFLSSAIKYGERTLAQWLLSKGANPNLKDNFNFSLLHYAVMDDNHDLVFLLKNSAGINIDAVNSLNETPLYLAAVSPKHSKWDGFSVFDGSITSFRKLKRV